MRANMFVKPVLSQSLGKTLQALVFSCFKNMELLPIKHQFQDCPVWYLWLELFCFFFFFKWPQNSRRGRAHSLPVEIVAIATIRGLRKSVLIYACRVRCVCMCLREAQLLWPLAGTRVNGEHEPLEPANQLIPSAAPNKHSNASEVLKLFLFYTQIVTKKLKQKSVFHFLCSTWNDNHLRCVCMCVCLWACARTCARTCVCFHIGMYTKPNY